MTQLGWTGGRPFRRLSFAYVHRLAESLPALSLRQGEPRYHPLKSSGLLWRTRKDGLLNRVKLIGRTEIRGRA